MKNVGNSELRIIPGLRVVVDSKLDESKKHMPYRIASPITSVTLLVWSPIFALPVTFHLLITTSTLLFQVMFPPKGFDMKKRPKPRIRPVDYHVECCIEAGFWKNSEQQEGRGENAGYSFHLLIFNPI